MTIEGAKQYLLAALPGLEGEQLIRACRLHAGLCFLPNKQAEEKVPNYEMRLEERLRR